MRACCELPSD